MYMTEATLDDLLKRTLERLLRGKKRVTPTLGGTTEMTGVLLQLTNPRARLSHTEKKGKVFSGLGELLWYLARSNKLDFIGYYLKKYSTFSEDGKTIGDAYGPRLFAMRGEDQIQNVVRTLKQSRSSRRAVVQLFNAEDIAVRRKVAPCTCTFQFMVRRDRLEMITCMRSNDAFIGLPHDVFAFTMIQELIARTMDLEMGPYKHFVGSLHLYDADMKNARQYVDEGFQPKQNAAMPPMPWTDPWSSVKKLLRAESAIRRGKAIDIGALKLDPYWADLARLLMVFKHSRSGDNRAITNLRRQMVSPVYNAYIMKRIKAGRVASAAQQLDLPFVATMRQELPD
jgi:thymidylate synthase